MKEEKQTLIYNAPSSEDMNVIADILRSGGLVVFPTETVYGLGANALMPEAAKKVYEAKGRPSDNPLIIHLADAEDAVKYCHVHPLFNTLADYFMPGPLTVIMPKRDIIPYEVTGGLDTVAVRIPKNCHARELIRACGVPVAAPSANISGRPSPTCLDHVLEDMMGRADVIIDGGSCEIGLESTIIRIEKEGSVSILRPGAVTAEMLALVLPDNTEINDISMKKLGECDVAPAPGMKYKHYAPKAQVIVLSGDKDKTESFMMQKKDDKSVGFICSDDQKEKLGERACSYGKRDSSEQMAHNLFYILREFDKNDEIKTVYADMPRLEGIGLAVYNRLIKASGFTVLEVNR